MRLSDVSVTGEGDDNGAHEWSRVEGGGDATSSDEHVERQTAEEEGSTGPRAERGRRVVS